MEIRRVPPVFKTSVTPQYARPAEELDLPPEELEVDLCPTCGREVHDKNDWYVEPDTGAEYCTRCLNAAMYGWIA
jgi:NMD protein affecting ribosome stability and mRNA decay